MDQAQMKAMSLFQDGEYEAAIKLMSCSTTVNAEEYKHFVKQCNHLIGEQYRYMINDAVRSRDYKKAHSLRAEYVSKHGNNPGIDSIQLPDYTDHTTSTPVDDVKKKKNKNLIVLIVVVILLLAVLQYFLTLPKGRNMDNSSYQEDSYEPATEYPTYDYGSNSMYKNEYNYDKDYSHEYQTPTYDEQPPREYYNEPDLDDIPLEYDGRLDYDQ